MRILVAAPAFLAICIALIAGPAVPAEFARRGSVIYISGELGPDDYLDFMQVRGDLRHGTVVLNSLGGYNMTAMLIGGNIHERQFETVVRSGDFCSSACTLIWLAGKPRYLGHLAKLGFHSAGYPDRPGERNEEANRQIADYFKRIGVPQQVIDLQPMADPCCLNYVDYLQAKVWGLLKEQPTKQESQEVANRKSAWLKPSPSKPSPSPFPDPPPPDGQSSIPPGPSTSPLFPWVAPNPEIAELDVRIVPGTKWRISVTKERGEYVSCQITALTNDAQLRLTIGSKGSLVMLLRDQYQENAIKGTLGWRNNQSFPAALFIDEQTPIAAQAERIWEHTLLIPLSNLDPNIIFAAKQIAIAVGGISMRGYDVAGLSTAKASLYECYRIHGRR